jgi:ATP-dependent Clp protease adaptor protein ClpS
MTYAQLTLPRSQVEPDELVRQLTKLLPPYKVILYNDDVNEMNYVVFALLRSVNTLSPQEAVNIMYTAHQMGSAIVVVCPKELAEYYQERLLGFGLTATIEPE